MAVWPSAPGAAGWAPCPASSELPSVCRRNADETPQNLAHLSKVQAAVEVLDEVEDVALRLTERIPPAPPVMGDDQDLTLGATIFQGAARALPDVQPPAADHALQNRGAVHAAPEQLELGIIGHGAVLPGLLGAAGWRDCAFPNLIPSQPGDREAGGVQGRRLCRRRPRSGFPCGPTGASGSRATFLRLRRGLGRGGNPTFCVESTRARPSSGLRRIFSLWRLLALEGSASRPNRPNWADVESARASGCCRTAHWLEFACGAARLPPVR